VSGLEGVLTRGVDATRKMEHTPDAADCDDQESTRCIRDDEGHAGASVKVVRHGRETVLRLVGNARRQLADAARLALATGPPLIASA
jgi:hypothetical protein